MRRIISLLAGLFLALNLSATDLIRFSDAKWNEIQKQSAAEKKYVFLDCYTDWCYWCKVMDKETFIDTSVTNFINANFIPTRREMEKDEEGKALSMKYHINGFPTYCIFNTEGLLVYKIIGYMKGEDFLKELKIALTKTTPLIPGLSANLDPGFPDFYKESFGTSKKRKMPDQKVITDFLDTQSDLTSEVCWSVMWRFNVGEKYENWIIEHRDALTAKYTADEVNGKMIDIFLARNDRAAQNKDDAAFQSNLAMMEKYFPEESRNGYKLTMTAHYYQKTGNWKAYAATVQSYADTSGTNGYNYVNSCAWDVYEQCDDKAVITQAITWMDTVCANSEQYAYEDTYAAVLYKGGQYKKAEEVALHAIDLGKNEGEDVSGTEALLANIRLKIK